jgi:hypothetical protein
VTYTKAQIEDAVEVLLTGNYGLENICTLHGSLAWDALRFVWRVAEDKLADSPTEETYAEAAGLLLDGWLPGDPL